MKLLYKVGDLVLIKSEYDKGCDEYDYRFTFTNYMRSNLGGSVYTIKSVEFRGENPDKKQISDDGYLYHLKEDDEGWSWASSMFEPEF